MPIFQYIAVDADGKEYKGVMEAESKDSAATKLQRQRLMVTTLKRKWIVAEWFKKASAGQIKRADILLFSRQLATLVKARIPIEQCLEVLIGQIQNVEFQNVIKQVRSDVISGTPLSTALGKYSKIFSPLYIGMLKAGEASGKLPEILVRTARFMERTARLVSRVKAAMIYPVLVICVGIVVITFIMVGVIPQFESMYATFKGDLPLITKIMIFISRELLGKYVFAMPYFIIEAIALVFIILGLRSLLKAEKSRYKIDEFILQIPVLGSYLQKVIFAKFSQTLGILVSNGVPILESLSLVAKIVGNKPVESSILEAREKIKEGEKIADTLKKGKFFPPLVVQMVNVGEQTGKLGEVLEQISEFYEEEVEISTQALVSIIEPLLILGLAGVVAIIVVSLYLPIFRMYSQMSKVKPY
ncbi:MAG: type II secretion system F family protein [Candidatus Firestonebacteria bacterium]